MKFSNLFTLALAGSAAAGPFAWSQIDAIHDIVKRQKDGGVTAGDVIPSLEDLLKSIKKQTKKISMFHGPFVPSQDQQLGERTNRK